MCCQKGIIEITSSACHISHLRIKYEIHYQFYLTVCIQKLQKVITCIKTSILKGSYNAHFPQVDIIPYGLNEKSVTSFGYNFSVFFKSDCVLCVCVWPWDTIKINIQSFIVFTSTLYNGY